MIYNRIPVVFGNLRKITIPPVSFQYDIVQKLIISGLELPEYYQVDFCNEGDSTTITMVGTADGVDIPDQFLQTGRNVKAYLVVTGVDDGAAETRYEITIPVNKRPARTDIEPTPVEQSTIDSLIAAMNDAVDDAEASATAAEGFAENAEASAERAEQAAQSIDGKVERAEAAAQAAGVSATRAEDAAEDALGYKNDAAESAGHASSSAEDARNSKETAIEKADEAEQSAAQAAASAESAEGDAQEAEQAAQQATQAASAASQSATSAQGSATAADGSATVATNKAAEASASATTASGKATEAANSATAAQTAQTGAEAAQAAAEAVLESIPADYSQLSDDVSELKNAISELVDEKPIEQSDLVFTNSNFVVNNGAAYAVSVVSPYNCMVIDAERIDFKYRRRSSYYSFYVGVCIDGKFVGNRTNAVVAEIKTLYDTTNATYTDATVNTSVADDTYGTDYHDYSATLTGQVFELKKGPTTILKFTVSNDKTIQGIAFLNYRFDYYSTTDNTDFKDGTIVTDKVGAMIDAAVEPVDQLAKRADIIGLQSNHRMVAGVIRNTGSRWEFIVNDRHQGDMNCLSVGVAQDGRLYVDYTGINAKKVISLIAAPDEAFANAGYIMGASVGLDKAYIQIYQYGLQSVSAQIRANNDGTFTVESSDGVTSAEWNSTNNTLDITHDTLTNKVASTAANVSILPCFYGKLLPRIYSTSATKTRIEFFDTTNAQKITTPGTNMSVNFCRYGSLLVRNEVSPATLVSANGNIWFMGIFEV